MSGRALTLIPRPVAASVDELLAAATSREPFLTSDSKSGSPFERVVIDGDPFIVKYVDPGHDWTMRMCGDIGCMPLQVWKAGLMDVLPEHIEHGMVAVAGGLGELGRGAALLMRDLSAELVPPGDDVLPLEQHRGYIDTMAALTAATLGWDDGGSLVPMGNRWAWFGDEGLEIERAGGWVDPVPKIAAEGWERFASRVPPRVLELIGALRRDASPLVEAAATTPWCFLHGDWKLGNVGTAADGRTVLIDWTYPGSGPVGHELGWYLAINRSRLPEPKEDVIAALRGALARHGAEPDGWFDRQVGICLLGTFVQFGWEKAYGDDDELGWWCDRALEGAALV